MTNRLDTSTKWSGRARFLPPKRRLDRKSHSAWHDSCAQCGFPWGMHPERYDAEEAENVRFCSEYPAPAPWSIQACIRP